MLIKTTLRKENIRQRNFKKPFEFNSFSEICYCDVTRLSSTGLGIFMQCQYIRIILRNKNMGQSLFKKHSKLRWNILLWYEQTQEYKFGYFYAMSAHKNHFKKQKYRIQSAKEIFKIPKVRWNIIALNDKI